jgi:hypothetical protein
VFSGLIARARCEVFEVTVHSEDGYGGAVRTGTELIRSRQLLGELFKRRRIIRTHDYAERSRGSIATLSQGIEMHWAINFNVRIRVGDHLGSQINREELAVSQTETTCSGSGYTPTTLHTS